VDYPDSDSGESRGVVNCLLLIGNRLVIASGIALLVFLGLVSVAATIATFSSTGEYRP